MTMKSIDKKSVTSLDKKSDAMAMNQNRNWTGYFQFKIEIHTLFSWGIPKMH